MASIKYEEVYSRFFTKVEAFDLFEENLTDDTRNELLCNWLHSATSYPYVSRLFSSLVLTDKDETVKDDTEQTGDTEQTTEPSAETNETAETEEKVDKTHTIDYTLKYTIDDNIDKEFVLEIFSMGMVLSWVKPKVNSIVNTAQIFGTSDQKWYSQSNHLSELQNLQSNIQAELRNMIRDRGYANNTYLDGSGTS